LFIYSSRISFKMMKSIIFVGIIAAMAIATTAGHGLISATAQMADNATMGNMTGGNMSTTMGAGNMSSGNSTDGTGNISSFGGVL
jgi:hypothetical protein